MIDNMIDKKHNYIRNCLRRHRRARGLTQQDVAAMLGLKSASIISRWENGACLPTTRNVFKLAVLYRTMVDALYFDLLRSLRQQLRESERAVLDHDA